MINDENIDCSFLKIDIVKMVQVRVKAAMDLILHSLMLYEIYKSLYFSPVWPRILY